MRAEKAEAALATAEHCSKDYATERACGECLRCLRTMCEIEAEGNCNRTMEICALQAALATAREQLKQLEARDYFQKCLEDPEMRKKVAAEWMNEENIELRVALATSRAMAFEEAARWHDAAAAESERAAEMYEKRGLRVDEQAWASLQELERLIEEAIKAEPAEAPEWIEGACPECERWQTTGHRRSCSKFKPAALEGAK